MTVRRKARKPVHINLHMPLHKAFRKTCIDKNVTMQEILEYLIVSIVEKDEDIYKVFVDFSKNKRSKIKKIASIEADDIYNSISDAEESEDEQDEDDEQDSL